MLELWKTGPCHHVDQVGQGSMLGSGLGLSSIALLIMTSAGEETVSFQQGFHAFFPV